MKVKINVTQEDIDKGVRDNGLRCPIARALRRIGCNIGNGKLYVRHIGIYGCETEKLHIVSYLPNRIKRFINEFDNKNNPRSSFKPFSFTLDIPKKYLKEKK